MTTDKNKFKKEMEASQYFMNRNAKSMFDVIDMCKYYKTEENAVRQTNKSDEGSFVNLLNKEMEELIKSMKDKEKYIDNSWRAKMVENGIYKDSEITSEEKQIFEMAKVVCKTVNKKELKHCEVHCDIDCLGIARELLKYYRPKPKEDNIVQPTVQSYSTHDNDLVILSREEYEEYRKFKSFMERNDWENVEHIETTLDKCQEVLYERLQQAHKGTAEKAFEITKKIIDKKYSIETPSTRVTLSNIINQIEKEFTKQFNIEIKE